MLLCHTRWCFPLTEEVVVRLLAFPCALLFIFRRQFIVHVVPHIPSLKGWAYAAERSVVISLVF